MLRLTVQDPDSLGAGENGPGPGALEARDSLGRMTSSEETPMSFVVVATTQQDADTHCRRPGYVEKEPATGPECPVPLHAYAETCYARRHDRHIFHF